MVQPGRNLSGGYPPSPQSVLPSSQLDSQCRTWEASGHLDGSIAEVDLWIMLAEPHEAKDHALLSKLDNCQQDLFGMSTVGHEDIDNFVDTPTLIKCSVYIVDWDRLRELVGGKFGCDDKVSIDEVPSCTSVNHGLHGICHL